MAVGSAPRKGGGSRRITFLGTLVLLCAAAPVAAQDGDTWGSGAPLPTARRLLAAATEGGKLYTFGGCGSPCFGPPSHLSTLEETRVEVYDPAADSWESRRPIPAIFFGGAAAAPGNGRIYLLGGFLTGDRVLEYDPATDAWRSRAPMPTARHGLAAVALGGKVYALGGSDGERASGALEIYDPATDSWTAGTPLPTPRVFLAAAAVEGKLYAVGGSPDCCGESQSAVVEVYDPATGRWSAAAPLPGPRQVSAAAAAGGKLYVFGGIVPRGGSGAGVLDETIEYDPATDTWTARAPMPMGKDQAPAALLNGRILVPGGSVDCHCRALGEVLEYTPREPPPRRPRADLAITIDDGVEIVRSGQQLAYTIRVENRGPDPVEGAVVWSSVVPDRLTGVVSTCTPGAGASCGPGGVIAGGTTELLEQRVDLQVGSHSRLAITATVEATIRCPTDGELTATATITPPPHVRDSVPGNNLDTDRDAIAVRADLFVTKDDGRDAVGGGEEVTYTLRIGNRGPDAACGARVRDLFPPELDDVTWSCATVSPPVCSSGVGDLDDLVTLSPGDALTYTARGTAVCTGAGTLDNTVTVTAPVGIVDPRPPGDNDATDSDELVCAPELELEKARRGLCQEGEVVRHKLVVRNLAPVPHGDNPGDELTDTLPRELTLLDAVATSGTVSRAGNTVTWNGEVGPLEEVTLTLSAEIEAGTLGSLVCNQAFLTADSDGDGVNDALAPSDDPRLPGAEDPTCFEVCAPGLLPIPALSPVALILLATLLGLLGWLAAGLAGAR